MIFDDFSGETGIDRRQASQPFGHTISRLLANAQFGSTHNVRENIFRARE